MKHKTSDAVLIGLSTFVVAEIGVGAFVYQWGGGSSSTNEMLPILVIYFGAMASPFCMLVGIMAGWFVRR
jgi:hypothetical protein